MIITFSTILIALYALIKPLQKNGFYILNSCIVIGIGYYFQQNYVINAPIFSKKIIMMFLLVQVITMNITTFVAYGVDKSRAKSKKYRISEEALLWLQILGGFIGAVLGQKFFKHKTKKASFRAKFWAIFLLETAIIIYVIKELFNV